jgi:DNA invertase Pin-like site-specific DNA recombinase
MQQFVSYLRVSTDRQGASGLGLEAQRAAVLQHMAGRGELVAEFLEVESGKNNDRPQIQRALVEAKRKGAVLVIAKLDRLARNVAFISSLLEAGVEIEAADMPHASRFEWHIRAAIAEEEGRAISARTKAALQVAKARGVALGSRNPAIREALERGQAQSIATRKAAADAHAATVSGRLNAMQREGLSLRQMAERLNSEGVATARGGQWHAATVRNILQRGEPMRAKQSSYSR